MMEGNHRESPDNIGRINFPSGVEGCSKRAFGDTAMKSDQNPIK